MNFYPKEFIIGGLAGAGATVVTNPMDVVKTRLQLEGELRSRTDNANAAKYRGLIHAVRTIARTDGLLSLQAGLVPALVLGFTMNSVRLGIYRIAELNGYTKNKKGETSINKAAFWSSFSGVVSGIAANPASVVKTRIQAASHPSIAVGRQHKYNGMWHGLVTIYQTEGVRGFYAGVNGTCSRLAIGSAAQLTTYSLIKEVLVKYKMCESTTCLSFSASCVSGVVLAVILCPIDVVTVRLYNQGRPSTCSAHYTGVIDCLTKIYKIEGIHGLYKGIGPLYLRIAPHTTLSLVIWDFLNDWFDKIN